MTDNSWMSYKIYLGRYADQMDFASVFLANALKERLAPKRWFYIRYTDGGGVHLRFRWQGGEGTPAEQDIIFHDLTEDLFCELVMAPPSVFRPMVAMGNEVMSPQAGGESRQAFAVADPYHPEYEVFLGEEGIETAHDLFQSSSELAIQIVENELEGGPSRKSFIAPMFRVVLDQMIADGKTQADFLVGYCEYWTSQGGLTLDYMLEEFEDKALSLIDNSYQLFDVPAGLKDQLDQWDRAISRAKAAYGDSIPDMREFPDNLAFRFIHLMNNRLGIGILDEAYMAVVLNSFMQREAA